MELSGNCFPHSLFVTLLHYVPCKQSMEWTGSIRWIYNPVQSRRIWIGLDQKFTNSADSGLDWIQKCAMCIPYLDLRQFLLIVTLTSEVLPSNLQLFTSSFVFTCRFYKVFGRYLCTLLCPDWTGLDSDSGSSAGLDWIRISGSWIWTGLDRFNSIHSILCLQGRHRRQTYDAMCGAFPEKLARQKG